MKSYVSFLEGLYTALLADVQSEYPKDALEWDRDLSRLRSYMDHVGTRFFTVDLPAMGKHFDKCLSEGQLTLSGLYAQRAFRTGVVIPRLFRGLLRRVFHDTGVIRSDVDTTAVLFLRELYYAAKKLRQECTPKVVYQTVKEYFDIEREVRLPHLEWGSDDLDLSNLGSRVSFLQADSEALASADTDQLSLFSQEQLSTSADSLSILQRVCDCIVGGEFGTVEWPSLRPKHGPGAVSDARVGIDSKYSFPHWPAKLERIFPIEEYGYANYSAWEEDRERDEGLESRRAHEPPSRLIAVPKTQKGPRLIASEPVCHQWIQQAIKRELDRMVQRSVLRFSISFADQELSRRLALSASRDGLRATVDLSSASDRLSCWSVERAFRSNSDLLLAFHACRTRWLVNTIDRKLPQYIILKKFAPMGSALTFPVQSIVYAMVAISAVLYCRDWAPNRASLAAAAKLVRVYGDDIILPVDCVGVLTELLSKLGLKVNQAKTFSRGYFRESCGMDAYRGVDVTPAYVLEAYSETRPESVASIVQSSNNFFKKGFWRTAQYLQSTIPEKVRKLLPVVSTDSEPVGFFSFVGSSYTHLQGRWNRALQRPENRILLIRSRLKRRPIDGWQSLLQYYTEAPNPDIVWSAGIDSRPSISLNRGWVPSHS